LLQIFKKVITILAMVPLFAFAAPKITEFRFEPESFVLGENVTLHLSYTGVKGGLENSRIRLKTKRQHKGGYEKSAFSNLITGDASEDGEISVDLNITPDADPPFTIIYSLEIRDKKKKKAKATASIRYEYGVVEGQGIDATTGLGLQLVANSPHKGVWHVADNPGTKGTSELVFNQNSHGALEAEITKSTGASFKGVVTGLELNGNELVFIVSSGARYRLDINDDGSMTGDARNGVALLEFTPTIIPPE
jgi:hypothetical protein